MTERTATVSFGRWISPPRGARTILARVAVDMLISLRKVGRSNKSRARKWTVCNGISTFHAEQARRRKAREKKECADSEDSDYCRAGEDS
jgi:hypothetical protein